MCLEVSLVVFEPFEHYDEQMIYKKKEVEMTEEEQKNIYFKSSRLMKHPEHIH